MQDNQHWIPELETNRLYYSELLQSDYPSFFKMFKDLIDELRIASESEPLKNTRDIWCRDYMPIQVSDEKFVQFKFNPDYLKGFPMLRTIPKEVTVDLPFKISLCDLTIDGGNVIRSEKKVILTSKIFVENPKRLRSDILKSIQKELEVEEIIIIPRDKEDITGHADGMVRFLDDDTVLMNDYKLQGDQELREEMLRIFKQHNLKPVHITYAPSLMRNGWGDFTALGVYINFLWVNGHVIVPRFNIPEDDEALKKFDSLFPGKVHAIDCTDIAWEGGVLNCISWNVKSQVTK